MDLPNWRRTCRPANAVVPVVQQRRVKRRQCRLEVESLEDRTLPSQLDITSGALTFSGANVANTLTVSLLSGTYTFDDPSDPIILTGGAISAGWGPISGPSPSVSGPQSSVNSMSITLGNNANTLNLGSFDAAIAPLAINGGGNASDTLTVSAGGSGLTASGDILVSAFHTISVNNQVTSGGRITLAAGGTFQQTAPITAAADITICNTGDLLLSQAVAAGGSNTVRLNAIGGAVTQTSSGIISGQNLGVSAATGIFLDTAVNLIPIAFAANNSSSGAIKFRDNAATLFVGLNVPADPPCFPQPVTGVAGPGDVTICNSGTLEVKAAITAGAVNTVRLTSSTDAVTQFNAGVISAANLAVSAATGIVLDAAVSAVTGIFAANDSTSGAIKFYDNVASLAIGTLGADSPCFPASVTGVSGPADVSLSNNGALVLNVPVRGAGSATVRLTSFGSSVTQTSNGVISGANLGVSADAGIFLDAAANIVTSTFAASNVTSGAVKFHGSGGSPLTIGTIAADAPTFPAVVTGVSGPADVTMCSDSQLILSAAVTAGSAGTVRLAASGFVTQTAAGVISAANLGVISSSQNVLLDQAVNLVSGTFAAQCGSGGNIKFFDNTATLTIATVSADAPCFPSAVSGATPASNVTICNNGSLVLNAAVGNGAAGTVRLSSTTGSVTQTAAGMISATNLGVSAATGIFLDAAINNVNAFTAIDSSSGAIKFRDSFTSVALGLTVSADAPCFPAAVTGVVGPTDITICNTGNVSLSKAVTAGAGGTVRLTSTGGSVGQAGSGVISSQNLGVIASTGVSLDVASNVVPGTFAGLTTSGTLGLRDTAPTLTVGTIATDLPCFAGVTGVTSSLDLTLSVDGSLAVNQSLNSGGGVTHLLVGLGASPNTNVNTTIGNGASLSGVAVVFFANQGIETLTIGNAVFNTNLNLGGTVRTTVSGAVSGPGGIINSAGTLDGTGTVAGAMLITQGSLDPGQGQSAVGTLTAGSVTLGAGVTLHINIGATASLLDANGSLNLFAASLNGTLLPGFTSRPGQNFVIAQSVGTLTDFVSLPEGAFVTIGTEIFQVNYVGPGQPGHLEASSQVILGDVGPAPATTNPAATTVVFQVNGTAIANGQSVAVTAGQSVSFTATVTSPGLAIQFGTVSISDGIIPLASVALGAPFTNTFTAGSHALTVNYTSSSPQLLSSQLSVTLVAQVPSTGAFPLPARVFVTAADAGGGPDVKAFAADGTFRAGFFAYDPGFTGGVRVAVADVNGDGFPDVICAAGPGGGPNVIVFSGKDRSEIANFFAYDIKFTGGVYVAAGDVNGDGFADIICGADAGGGPNVTVFKGAADLSLDKRPDPILSYFPYDIHFTGGVRVAAGDVNGDGRADIVTGAGAGGGPNVTVYQLVNGQPQVLQSYFAFDLHLSAGLFVGAGDVNGDGRADVIAGTGRLSGPDTQIQSAPAVAVFSGADASRLSLFSPFGPPFAVRVAATDLTGSGKASVIAVRGPGGTPDVDIFDGLTGQRVDLFFAYDPAFTGGLFLANTPK